MDAHDPVGYNNAQMPCGREAELRSAIRGGIEVPSQQVSAGKDLAKFGGPLHHAFLMDNLGRFSTAKSISDFLRSQKATASIETVQDYVRALEAAFALVRVNRYDVRGRRLLERTEKYFAGDLGLRTARRGFHADALPGILENIVLLELQRRGYRVSVGKLGEREVDFVADKDGDREYFQVAYRLADPKTVEREFVVLEAIPDNFPKTVLTLDRVPTKRSGIIHRYLPEWLLGR